MSKPHLLLLGTGGTIAATAQAADQLTDYTVSEGVAGMLATLPGHEALAEIRTEQLFNVDSRCLNTLQVLQLAHRVAHAVAAPDVCAVVITHGTDTLEETAFLLHLLVHSPKPVILVGAMRPASALSADGPLNLLHALQVARDPASRGRGVLVVMNDRIVAARWASKGHTTAVDAFNPHGPGALGAIRAGAVRFALSPEAPTETILSPSLLLARTDLPSVDIILDYQDAPLHPYQAAVQAGAQGLVVAALGNGSLSPAAQAGCALARQSGLVCVRASRVPQGGVSPSARDTPDGLLASHDLNPWQARIALRLALAQGLDQPAIGQWLARL